MGAGAIRSEGAEQGRLETPSGMTEAQQTEMDCSDPLRLLSVEGWGLGHMQGLRSMTEAALSWGLDSWISPRLCHQQAAGDWASHFPSASLRFLTRPHRN